MHCGVPRSMETFTETQYHELDKHKYHEKDIEFFFSEFEINENYNLCNVVAT